MNAKITRVVHILNYVSSVLFSMTEDDTKNLFDTFHLTSLLVLT